MENGQNPKDLYVAYLRGEIERLTALMHAVESGGEGLALDPAAAAMIVSGRPNNVVRPDSFFGMTTPAAKIHKEWGLSDWYSDRKLTEDQPTKRKGKKGKRRKAKASASTSPSQPESTTPGRNPFKAFNDFVRQEIARGKSRQEAIAAWRARQQ